MNTQNTNTATHDVVVIGAGVAGAVLAKHLTQQNLSILLLEAGPGTPQNLDSYDEHLQQFYNASAKSPGSPWATPPEVPQPDTTDLRFNDGYFVQRGPQLYGSSYSRLQGGSTLHWLGVSLRMLPEDFGMRTTFGVGRDWPLTYDDLEPYYRKAELDLGVSADVADQRYGGITFAEEYDFPMRRVPLSYSDQWLNSAIDGLNVSLGEQKVPVSVRSYPAARNSTPRPGYQPVGAIGRHSNGEVQVGLIGERCQGNTSCTPICPVQAKYNAGRTLTEIDPNRLDIRARAVASKLQIDPESGQITGVIYHRYGHGSKVEEVAVGRRYVLAAHAVENAKIMMFSGLNGPNDMVGANLMDHPTLYAWGLAPEPVYPFRGPLSTAGVEDLRGGPFRSAHAAFRFDVANDGWRAPTGAPDSTVIDQVSQGYFGDELRQRVGSKLTRQVRMSLAVEQLPDPANRISLDRRFLDPLGNPRPSIHYRIDDYTLAGMAQAKRIAAEMFTQAGIDDHTETGNHKWFPTVDHQGTTFHYHGMGHFAGTHLMGNDRRSSVVDHTQRSWDHKNLYLIGSGSFPTMGTSNPTLTIAALAARTAHHLASELNDT